jgi:hypothetical protein
MKKSSIQQTFNSSNRVKLRLVEIERLIKAQRIIVPAPSRRQLSRMCEEGIFETAGDRPSNFGWLVYEYSFREWLKNMDGV